MAMEHVVRKAVIVKIIGVERSARFQDVLEKMRTVPVMASAILARVYATVIQALQVGVITTTLYIIAQSKSTVIFKAYYRKVCEYC